MLKGTLIALLCLLSSQAFAFDLYVSTAGVTYHGYSVNDELAGEMPHRITDDGKWVYHPQDVTLSVRFQNSFHTVFTYLRDCFDEPAMMLGAGNQARLTERLGVGYLVGLYMRRRHYFIDEEGGLSQPADMPLTISSGREDFMPTAMVTASYDFMRDGNWRAALLFAGNGWINHLELGLGYSW